jgi:CheY-like chemotaxis protein
MLIDENDLDRFVVRKVIEQTDDRFGNIKTMSNARDALKDIETKSEETNDITLIFLDLYMPLINGFQFVEEFEKLPSFVREKYLIYALTASIDHNDHSRIMRFDSVRDIVEKPLTKSKLTGILQELDAVTR